ncbi:MAG: hypothetical protein AAFR52_15425 [Pseudomonadota bacterium]
MTGDRLVVRDRAIAPVLAMIAIAAVWGALGTGAFLYGDDQTTRLGGGAFALGAVPIALFGLWIARSSRIEFDRQRGEVSRTVRGLITGTDRATIPLARVRYAEIEVKREVADPDTYRLVLAVEPGPGWPEPVLPFREYGESGEPPKKLCALVNHWLGHG